MKVTKEKVYRENNCFHVSGFLILRLRLMQVVTIFKCEKQGSVGDFAKDKNHVEGV
jgi:hypothetical protein